ncbi:unnamed protein product [Anisakis simplex]|uniref:Cadherin_C domain-containing protein n=1 Tax=Anisakis simplex TaxID=6269 RepID=A0A0M3JXD0_ANISI|nr:unnamed protein product [Anisakis simplex]
MQRGVSILVGYWTQGTPEAITIDAEMAGIDPIYGFPRVCDNTPVAAMFQMLPIDPKTGKLDSNEIHDEKQMIVELEAKCFKARIAFAKHTERCPWCLMTPTQMSPQAIDVSTDAEARLDEDGDMMYGNELRLLGLGLLALLAVLSSTAFICILAMFLQQKRSLFPSSCYPNNKYDRTNRLGACSLQTPRHNINVTAPHDGYEEFLDQVHPYWLHCPANNTSTGLFTPVKTPASRPSLGQRTTVYHQLSANSTLGVHTDDSGLESF